MKKSTLVLIIAMLPALMAQAQFDKLVKKAKDVVEGGGISQEDAGSGLKEALNVGVGEAVSFLSAKDGYFKSPYKILLPSEAQKVVTKLKGVPGFKNLDADLTERLNRAAEDAAIKAKPIFIAAIKGMTFQDAVDILMGNPNAATQYLQRVTFEKLYAEFKPIIRTSLDKVNANQYWNKAITAYNKIPFVDKTNPNLDDHVNRKALAGMFTLVEKKEKNIRSDVSLRNTDLLKKVFAKQDKK